jgi:hypothetical protein
MKEQFKSLQKPCSQSAFYARNCGKKFGGQMKFPYEKGDCDFYCFCVVADRQFLEWRIPESFMDELGMLSHREEGMFVKAGKTSMHLYVSDGTVNTELQIKLFGALPLARCCTGTAQFLKVHTIPDEYPLDPVVYV